MKREPLTDYRVYLTWDPIKRCLVNSEHHDLRPDRGAKQDETGTTEKEIVIRVQKKDTGKPK